MMKNAWAGVAGFAALALLAGSPRIATGQTADPDSLKCSAAKLGAVSKDWAGQLKCYAKAVGKGTPATPGDPLLDACLSKVTTKTADSFTKAELKPDCPVDANAFDQNADGITDGLIGSIRHQIDLGQAIGTTVIYRGLQGPIVTAVNKGIVPLLITNPTGLSKCTSKKVNAASKLAGALYKCESSIAKKNLPPDPTCTNGLLTGKTDKAVIKFNAAFAKEEAKVGQDCQTTGDASNVASFLFQTFTKMVPSLPRFDGCGNNLQTPSEQCDDGNFNQFDSCPATCTIAACTPTATPQTVTVHLADGTATAATIELDYPEGKVSLPGTGFDPASIENIALASSFTSVDFDHALRIVVAEGGGLGNDIAQLDFVACNAAPAPVVGDFTCTVKDAADASSQPLTTTCSVTIP
jgi:cysteine-rich repeat protein